MYDNPQVLRGLSLRVRAGSSVALVGGSGCGKSTLLQLLQRLYEPDSGTITVDGHPLHALDLHHFRKSIGTAILLEYCTNSYFTVLSTAKSLRLQC